MTATRRILVVSQPDDVVEQIRDALARDGLVVEASATIDDALDAARAGRIRLLIADTPPARPREVDLLGRVRSERLPVGVVVLSESADTARAIEAMKAGADDVLTRPIDEDRLRLRIARVIERRLLLDELQQLRRHVPSL